MGEIWFSILTKQQVRRGVYRDVPELIAVIEDYTAGFNDRAKPSSGPRPPTKSSRRPSNDKPLQIAALAFAHALARALCLVAFVAVVVGRDRPAFRPAARGEGPP